MSHVDQNVIFTLSPYHLKVRKTEKTSYVGLLLHKTLTSLACELGVALETEGCFLFLPLAKLIKLLKKIILN